MRVCGHIPAFMTASQAIDAGYDEITHLNMLMLNFFGDTVDTRNMTRFKLVGKKGNTIDINSDEVKSFIQKLKDKNIKSILPLLFLKVCLQICRVKLLKFM